MEAVDFNKLDEAFDKCCVKATQNIKELKPHAAELLIFAKHHPNRPLVLMNVRVQLDRHVKKRNSYRSHERF